MRHLRTAIEALLDRHREQSGFRIEAEIALPDPMVGETRLADEIESTTYRLVQEALNNVAKHARASVVHVTVGVSDGELLLEVRDDGAGFDTDAESKGFGLAGMRERASLVGGTVTVSSDEHGTLVRARLPTRARAGPLAGTSGPEQAAS